MKKILVGLVLSMLTSIGFAQSSPGLVQGQVPSAAQWNSFFQNKLDYYPFGLPPLLGGTGLTAPGAIGNVLTSTGSGWVSQAPTVSGTSVVAPNIYGGSTPTSTLTLQSTSGIGTTDFIDFLVGNNGATRGMRIVDAGRILVNTTTDDNSTQLQVNGAVSGSTFTASTQFLAANGSSGSNAYGFAAQAGLGFYRVGSGQLGIAVAGTAPYGFNGQSSFAVGSNVCVSWTGTSNNAFVSADTGICRLGAASLVLGNGTSGDFSGSLQLSSLNFGFGGTAYGGFVEDLANTLALKNSTSAQTLRVYGTTTGPKYVSLSHDGTNALIDGLGGGDLLIGSANTFNLRPTIANTNVQNLGGASATWHTGYFGTSVVAPLFDALTSGVLNIGTTTATSIALKQPTTMSGALTYGGVTLSNSVTGTGSMVLSASPTFTGTVTTGALNPAAINATDAASFNLATPRATAMSVTGDSGNTVNSFGFSNTQTVQAGNTGYFNSFSSLVSTVASSFTMTSLKNYYAGDFVKGAGSTVTNEYGFISDNLTSASNNYAFYSAENAASNQWAFYGAGTASSYFGGSIYFGGGSSPPTLAESVTAPTIASGFGSGASVPNNNGTRAFTVNVGTGGSANSGVITMPASTTGWSCGVTPNGAPQAAAVTYSAPTSTTSITLTNYTLTTGVVLAWTSGTVLAVRCEGY